MPLRAVCGIFRLQTKGDLRDRSVPQNQAGIFQPQLLYAYAFVKTRLTKAVLWRIIKLPTFILQSVHFAFGKKESSHDKNRNAVIDVQGFR